MNLIDIVTSKLHAYEMCSEATFGKVTSWNSSVLTDTWIRYR